MYRKDRERDGQRQATAIDVCVVTALKVRARTSSMRVDLAFLLDCV